MSNLPEISQWDTGIYQIATTDPVLGGVDGIANKAARQLANRTQYLKEKNEATNGALNQHQVEHDPHPQYTTSTEVLELINQGMSYSPTRQYRAGDIIFVPDDDNVSHVGNFYEAYHPDGCLGKDPRDATNRPDGWTNTDPAAPYYWIKLGKWLDLPTIGTPVGLFTTTVPQGYLKLNGTTVSASKFWRLAQVYPDLVTSGNISLPDLRAEFIRGLDDGRGVDNNRAVGSSQGDAIRNITGQFSASWSGDHAVLDNLSGAFFVKSTGGAGDVPAYYRAMQKPNTAGFDASRIVPTADENRPRNIALLYATRF